MKAKHSTIGMAALIAAWALTGSASAFDYLCGLHGSAQLSPGLSASNTPLNGPIQFAFSGNLTDCQGITSGAAHLCAVGTLNSPSCLGSQIDGSDFVVCSGTCSAAIGVSPTCDGGATPLVQSHFSGLCAGATCMGSNPLDGAFFVVNFDQATINAAMQACNPISPGGGVTSAGFDGFEGRFSH